MAGSICQFSNFQQHCACYPGRGARLDDEVTTGVHEPSLVFPNIACLSAIGCDWHSKAVDNTTIRISDYVNKTPRVYHARHCGRLILVRMISLVVVETDGQRHTVLKGQSKAHFILLAGRGNDFYDLSPLAWSV